MSEILNEIPLETNNRCVLVLGSHRSGTSILTRALLACGVFLGENMYGPRYDNSKGFFEDQVTNQLNEAFLSKTEKQWNSLLLPDAVDAETVSTYQDGLRENVFRRFKNEQLWGLKDPRISRLWIYWLPVFADEGVEHVYILANRHPFSVASSLFKRDQMPEAQALALWATYQLDALEALLQHGGLVVDYDLMMDRSSQELNRIASFLGLETRLDPSQVAKFESEFLADGLRHSRYSTQNITEVTSPLQTLCLAIYDMLLGLAELPGGLTAEVIEHARTLVPGFRNELARSIDWLRAIDAMQAALVKVSKVLSEVGANSECEARLYISEIVDGQSLIYAKFRGATTRYFISSHRQILRLPMPADLMPLERIRLDPANRPVALVLHHLALMQANDSELWRWDGDVGLFVADAGLIFRYYADCLLILVLNYDPRFELALPKCVLTRVTADVSLVVEITPRPLLEVMSEVLSQNDRLIADLRADLSKRESLKSLSLPAAPNAQTLHLASEIENIASLLKNSLARRDQTIAQQTMQLKRMREDLLRAEAQLDLLKDVMLGGFEGDRL